MNNDYKNNLNNIRSKYILKQIFNCSSNNRKLHLINYSRYYQDKLDIGIEDYKNFFLKIEIEIIPINIRDMNYFINIPENDRNFYHIYFNDNEGVEISRNYFTENENINKIKIYIDEGPHSFEELFTNCYCIQRINFIRFNRDDINNMRYMFYSCCSLTILNINHFNTANVTDFSHMFYGCTLLDNLNLNQFNFNNATDMSYLFAKCTALTNLINANFNNNNDDLNMKFMFNGCSQELKNSIREHNPNIKPEAF